MSTPISLPCHQKGSAGRDVLKWLNEALKKPPLAPVLKNNVVGIELKPSLIPGEIELTLITSGEVAHATLQRHLSALTIKLKDGYADQVGVTLAEVSVLTLEQWEKQQPKR